MKLAYEKPEVTLEEYQRVDVLTLSLGDILPDLPPDPTGDNKETDLDDDDIYDPI